MVTRKSNPMVVNNGSGIKRDKRTGRELNTLKENMQLHTDSLWADEFENKLRSHLIASKVVELYKKENKRTRSDTALFLARLIVWLVIHPEMHLQIKAKDIKLNSRTVKKIIDTLERLGYIKVYQGFNTKDPLLGTYRVLPMAIVATKDLLSIKIS